MSKPTLVCLVAVFFVQTLMAAQVMDAVYDPGLGRVDLRVSYCYDPLAKVDHIVKFEEQPCQEIYPQICSIEVSVTNETPNSGPDCHTVCSEQKASFIVPDYMRPAYLNFGGLHGSVRSVFIQ
jgi:hypothetical protein